MDDLLELLLRLLWWPFKAWKETSEDSYVGVSPHEEESMGFWRKFAITGTCLVAVAGAVVWWFLG